MFASKKVSKQTPLTGVPSPFVLTHHHSIRIHAFKRSDVSMQVFLTVPSASLFLGTVPNYFSAYSLLKYVLSIFTHIFDAEMGCALSRMQQSYQTRN